MRVRVGVTVGVRVRVRVRIRVTALPAAIRWRQVGVMVRVGVS